MNVKITMELPDTAFSAFHETPEGFVKRMRLAAAAKWYEMGLVSQSKAAEVAGVSRQEFLDALSELGVSPFHETPDEIQAELVR